MDRQAQRSFFEFILALENTIAQAEAAPIVDPRELALMERDLADLRRFAARLGADNSANARTSRRS
jgi:hypothetical protein